MPTSDTACCTLIPAVGFVSATLPERRQRLCPLSNGSTSALKSRLIPFNHLPTRLAAERSSERGSVCKLEESVVLVPVMVPHSPLSVPRRYQSLRLDGRCAMHEHLSPCKADSEPVIPATALDVLLPSSFALLSLTRLPSWINLFPLQLTTAVSARWHPAQRRRRTRTLHAGSTTGDTAVDGT